MVEANVGIICASLLALKPLMAYLFPQRTKERQPPRWSLTLNTVPTAETTEPDAEKGRVEEEEPVVPRTMSSTDRLEKIQEELEDSDELTLVGTRQSYVNFDMKRERTRSWSEQTILDMEGIIARPVPAVTTSLTAHMAEQAVDGRSAALDQRRESDASWGTDR